MGTTIESSCENERLKGRIAKLESRLAEARDRADTMSLYLAECRIRYRTTHEQLSAAKAERDALKLDGERMSYLESRYSWSIGLSDHPDHEGEVWVELHSIDGCPNDREYNLRGEGETLRAAVDAARAAITKEGETTK